MADDRSYYEFMTELRASMEETYGKVESDQSYMFYSMNFNHETDTLEMKPMEFKSMSNPQNGKREAGDENLIKGKEMMDKARAGQLFIVSDKEPFLSQVRISPTTGKIMLVPLKENPIKIPENETDPEKLKEWKALHDRFGKLVGGSKENNRWWRFNKYKQWRARREAKKIIKESRANAEREWNAPHAEEPEAEPVENEAGREEPVAEARQQEPVAEARQQEPVAEARQQEPVAEARQQEPVGKEEPKVENAPKKETLLPKDARFREQLQIMYHMNKTNGASAKEYGTIQNIKDDKQLSEQLDKMQAELIAEEQEFDDKIWSKVRSGDFKEAAAVVAGGLKHLSTQFDNSQVMDSNAIITGTMLRETIRTVREYSDEGMMSALKNNPEYKENKDLYRGKARMARIADQGARAREAISQSAEKGEKQMNPQDLSKKMSDVMAADMINGIKMGMLDGKPESMAKVDQQIKELGKIPNIGNRLNEVKREFQKTNTFGELVKNKDPKKVDRMLSNRVYMQRKCKEATQEVAENVTKEIKAAQKSNEMKMGRKSEKSADSRKREEAKVLRPERRERSRSMQMQGRH